MSSTNRSEIRNFHVSDYYITPIDEIKKFLHIFLEDTEISFKNKYIIDCCAGGNKIIKNSEGKIIEIAHDMSYPKAIEEVFNETVETYDIRNDSLAMHKCNYLEVILDKKPDIIITNPPFKLAKEIITKSLSDIKDHGVVIMLLRLNYFGSQQRKEFWKNNMPKYCYVHSQRMSFIEKKDENGCVIFKKDGTPCKAGTDSIEYAHYVWVKGENPQYCNLKII